MHRTQTGGKQMDGLTVIVFVILVIVVVIIIHKIYSRQLREITRECQDEASIYSSDNNQFPRHRAAKSMVSSSSSAGSCNRKYIKGGALSGGNGSYQRPWNSLAQAENGSWDTLIVLPSLVVIDGSITLQDGQNIQGQKQNQALFTSSLDDGIHNGDIFVGNGDNTISNITVVSAYRCAINAFESRDLRVTDCNINNSNTSNSSWTYDYVTVGNTLIGGLPWASISFYGGPNLPPNTLQPLSTTSGKVVISNSSFSGSVSDIVIGCGDNVSIPSPGTHWKRKYEISECNFSNGIPNASFSPIIIFTATGGKVSGTTDRCQATQVEFDGFIEITGIRGNNPFFPGRGTFEYGSHKVTNCKIDVARGFGILCVWHGDNTDPDAHWEISNNVITNYSQFNTSPPAILEAGAAAIQIQADQTDSGLPIHMKICGNTIIDSTGLQPSITFYLLGSLPIIADIQDNTITGTTTGIDILTFNQGSGNHNPSGQFYLAYNKFENTDTILAILSDNTSLFSDLTIKAENNCVKDVGARNSPSMEGNGSYYGGAIIVGGATSVIGGIHGLQGPLGNVIVDFGGGSLGSKGHNTFLGVAGPLTWIETGKSVTARHNYYSSVPFDAGAGGSADFTSPLSRKPKCCDV